MIRHEAVLYMAGQGSQYGSDDWRRFCRSNGLRASMSRRGNCRDNAVTIPEIFLRFPISGMAHTLRFCGPSIDVLRAER